MLFIETVESNTFSLLRELSKEEFLENFRLAGGTSLALQIGHRVSIDLDFFTVGHGLSFDEYDLAKKWKTEVLNKTESILNTYIDDVKVDFVATPYPFISKERVLEKLRLASMEDIGAMKFSAVTGRGSKKDFIDIHFLLQHYSFQELLGFFSTKYRDASEFLLFKSLMYFEDADNEPLPKMLKPITWEEVKNSIKKEVEIHFP